jgi:hypothetical protein
MLLWGYASQINSCSLHQERDMGVITCDPKIISCTSGIIEDRKSAILGLIQVDETHCQQGSVPQNLIEPQNQSFARVWICNCSGCVNDWCICL